MNGRSFFGIAGAATMAVLLVDFGGGCALAES
jgi:hypothetical protein